LQFHEIKVSIIVAIAQNCVVKYI